MPHIFIISIASWVMITYGTSGNPLISVARTIETKKPVNMPRIDGAIRMELREHLPTIHWKIKAKRRAPPNLAGSFFSLGSYGSRKARKFSW